MLNHAEHRAVQSSRPPIAQSSATRAASVRTTAATLTSPDPDLTALAATTQDVYERNARRFDAERSKGLHERVWLDRFLALTGEAGRVLDLGCGTGDPIAAYMTERGFHVIGIDASAAMLAIARERFPTGDWRQGDMRDLDLPETFDGIIGWNSFFHLRQDEQRSVLRRLAAHLNPGGALMLTVGPHAGEVAGHVGDDPIYHSSLAPEEYKDALARLSLDIVRFTKEDPDCGRQSVLLAQRRR